ncbi:hypothetical protein DFN09_002058 [Clostridium acetobutylicum]|nr:hypothetical protein [Clostridium acetobutylicum]
MRARVLLNGGTQTQANKLNLLDVIANEQETLLKYM